MTLKALYIELYYGEYSRSEAIKKVIKYTEKNKDIPNEIFVELLELYPDYKPLLLNLIQTIDPEFLPNCLEAEILAAKFFQILYLTMKSAI